MARNFAGGTDGILLPAAASPLGISRPFSISAWFNTTTPANIQTIFTVRNSNTQFYGLLLFNSKLNADNAVAGFAGATTILANTWYHFLFTCDSSGNGVAYLNGVSDGTGTTVNSAFSGQVATPSIGYDSANSGRQFLGKIADCTIWNTNLTAGEASGLGKNGARPYQIRTSNIINWMPIDGQFSPEPDLSGNKQNGTVTGTTVTSGPPMMMLTPRWQQGLDVVAASFKPWFAQNKNFTPDGVFT